MKVGILFGLVFLSTLSAAADLAMNKQHAGSKAYYNTYHGLITDEADFDQRALSISSREALLKYANEVATGWKDSFEYSPSLIKSFGKNGYRFGTDRHTAWLEYTNYNNDPRFKFSKRHLDDRGNLEGAYEMEVNSKGVVKSTVEQRHDVQSVLMVDSKGNKLRYTKDQSKFIRGQKGSNYINATLNGKPLKTMNYELTEKFFDGDLAELNAQIKTAEPARPTTVNPLFTDEHVSATR